MLELLFSSSSVLVDLTYCDESLLLSDVGAV